MCGGSEAMYRAASGRHAARYFSRPARWSFPLAIAPFAISFPFPIAPRGPSRGVLAWPPFPIVCER